MLVFYRPSYFIKKHYGYSKAFTKTKKRRKKKSTRTPRLTSSNHFMSQRTGYSEASITTSASSIWTNDPISHSGLKSMTLTNYPGEQITININPNTKNCNKLNIRKRKTMGFYGKDKFMPILCTKSSV